MGLGQLAPRHFLLGGLGGVQFAVFGLFRLLAGLDLGQRLGLVGLNAQVLAPFGLQRVVGKPFDARFQAVRDLLLGL